MSKQSQDDALAFFSKPIYAHQKEIAENLSIHGKPVTTSDGRRAVYHEGAKVFIETTLSHHALENDIVIIKEISHD